MTAQRNTRLPRASQRRVVALGVALAVLAALGAAAGRGQGYSPICVAGPEAARFATPTRLVHGPYAFHTRDSRAGPYVAVIFRLNHEPLNCGTNTRGEVSVNGVYVGAEYPTPNSPSAVQRQRHTYCYYADTLSGHPLSKKPALLKIPDEGQIDVVMRFWTRLPDGSIGLMPHSIRRTVRLRRDTLAPRTQRSMGCPGPS